MIDEKNDCLPKTDKVVVVGDIDVPIQQTRIAKKILRSADTYQQSFIKFTKEIGIFHCYQELLHAALLESDPEVTSFTPQPYSLYVGQRRYIPDCFYVKSGKKYVVEIKPRGEFKDELKIPLEEYFSFHNISFKVISNEDILKQENKALNWLQIIRTLKSSELEDTVKAEYKIYDDVITYDEQTLGDILITGDRINYREREIALFRLLHRGMLKIDYKNKDINYETKVKLCI